MDFLKVTAAPHMKHEDSTKLIMLDVIIALCPTVIWGTYIFGYRTLTVCLVSMLSAVLFEYLYRLIMKKSNTIGDYSAAVTGLLLALSLPVAVPLWIPVIGSFFAIVIVKQLYGGIGKNVVNPALAARIFLFIAYPTEVSLYTKPMYAFSPLSVNVSKEVTDVVAGATPLVNLKNGIAPTESPFHLFIGNNMGCIGEVSVLLLLAGALYLVIRKIITLHIPLAYIGTVAVLTYFFPAKGIDNVSFMLYELLTGSLIIGAFFMATDYTTSPVTNSGKIIYGIGCGAITVFIRYFGGYAEGVSFSILIMNLLVWYIDKLTKPRVYGGGKKHVKQ